jgi:hypothetical protein
MEGGGIYMEVDTQHPDDDRDYTGGQFHGTLQRYGSLFRIWWGAELEVAVSPKKSLN